jgi:hypothetical protein
MKRALFFFTLLLFLSTFCFACDGVGTIEEGLITTITRLNDKNYIIRDFCESGSPKINNGDIINTNLLENSAREKTNQETKIVLGFDNFQQNELTINQTDNSQIATYNGPFLSYTKVNEIVFCGKDKNNLIEGMKENASYFEKFEIEGIFDNTLIESNCDNNKICCAIALQKSKSIFTTNGLYIITLGIVVLTIFLIFILINSAAKITKRPKEDFRILGLIIPIFVLAFVVTLFSTILINKLNPLGVVFSLPLIPLLLIEYILRKRPSKFRLNAFIIIQIGIMAAITLIVLAILS